MSNDEQEVGSSESPKLGHWGLWSLDFFEGTVRPPREASAIERFEHVGEALRKLTAGQTRLTYHLLSLDCEERILVEGPEPRLLFIEDMIGFTKMGEGFLEAKEELKVIRKRYNALLVFHKMALRLERCHCRGISFAPDVPAESVHAFALLLREPPLPDARRDYERLQDELRSRGITGVELLSKDDLISKGTMDSAARVMLTLMSQSCQEIADADLTTWAMGFQRLAGTQVAQDMISNLWTIAEGERLELMQAAFLAAMEAPELVNWRAHLEEQGSKLAQEMVKEVDPTRRAELEARLKWLSRLLDKVTSQIPEDMLAEVQAKREGQMEERKVEQLAQVAAALLADPIAFLKKMSGEREQQYYQRSLEQCTEAFPALIQEHVPIARVVLQALQAHLRPVPELPWRLELATQALRDLATERNVGRFLELYVTPDKPENKDHARAALIYLGAFGLPHLGARLERAPADEAAVAQQAAAMTLMREMAQISEPYLAAKVSEAGAPLPVVKAALDVIGALKKHDRFEIVSRYVTHSDNGVRESALRALAILDPAKGQALIKRNIGDRDFNIARTAILLMGELKTQDWMVIQQFLETVKRREKDVPEPDERLQLVTAQALGMLGNINLRTGGNLEDHLLELAQPQQQEKKLFGGGGKLKDKPPTVRAALCEALGQVGGEKTLQVMRKLALNDPSEAVKAKARDAVKAINARATARQGAPAPAPR